MKISSAKLTGKVALLWGELGHVLLHVDDAHVGAVLLGDAEEFHNTLVVLDVAVDQDEKEFTLNSVLASKIRIFRTDNNCKKCSGRSEGHFL